ELCTPVGEFKQVLSNLLVNAIDASREGGEIVIRAKPETSRSGHGGVRVTIANNGTGIAAEDRPNLFTPFFTTKKEVGTGLGLGITGDLVEKKGASTRFRSRTEPPTGTAMSIFMPQAPAPDCHDKAA